VLENVFWDL
jgi:hypothetical protein